MAQEGYTPLQTYSSDDPGKIPSAGNLSNNDLGSELAINIADGKLFYKDSSNAVQVIAWRVTPATAGGTGQTSYAAGDLLYASAVDTLARLATGSGVLVGGVTPSYSSNPNIDIQGNAATASAVDVVTNSANNTFYPTFVDADNVSENAESLYTDAGLTYNPSSNLMTVTNLTVTNNINANITGNASSADQVKTQTNSTNVDFYPTFVDADNVSATNESLYTDAGITYNPSSNLLTVSSLSVTNTINANISGNSASADQIKTVTNNTNASFYPTFVDANNLSETNESLYTDAGVTYNPSTNTLTATSLSVINTANASISGTAAVATATTITNDTSTNATMYPTWVSASAGNLSQTVTSTKLVFNPSTGYFGCNGIQFNGDTSAVNALDDYEEGSWTVSLYDASVGGNVSSTTITGYYTKIGNVVNCSFINLNDIDTSGMTAGNQLYFTLPFQVGANGSGIGSCTTEVFNFGTNLTQINPIAEAGQTRGRFMTSGSNVANAYLTVAAITSGVSDIERLTITYFT
jgi:hypothetical protein